MVFIPLDSERRLKMLMEKIDLNNLAVGVNAKNWEEAIRKSSEILLKRGAIESRYVEEMIKAIDEKGPYIVISPHVALAHTRPEYGVNEMGLSFTLLENPVNFGTESFDPVKLIITLAATDNESHLDLLSELAEVLMDDERVNILLEAKTEEAFYHALIGN